MKRRRFFTVFALLIITGGFIILLVRNNVFSRLLRVKGKLSKDPAVEKFRDFFPDSRLHISYFAHPGYSDKIAHLTETYEGQLEFRLFFYFTLEDKVIPRRKSGATLKVAEVFYENSNGSRSTRYGKTITFSEAEILNNLRFSDILQEFDLK